MFKRLGKKVAIETVALIALGAMFVIPLVETASNGVLKKNGQKIWCKMQGKGNDFCDAQCK